MLKTTYLTLTILAFFISQTYCYVNPVQGARDSPDPGVIRVGDFYYAVTTGSQNGKAYPMWRSEDLFVWEQIGWGLYQFPVWAVRDFWAPQIHFVKGSYHLYFTAIDAQGNKCIGLATAQVVTGPYIGTTIPLVRNLTVGVIDCTVYQYNNGTIYLLYKTDGNGPGTPTQIMAAQMSSDGRKVVGKNYLLFRNDLPWQGDIVQAPWVVKKEQYFYVFYSACFFLYDCYSIGVARAKDLLGPYEKYPQPILHTRDPQTSKSWQGPGHCSVIKSTKDNWAIVYHAWPHGEARSKRVLLVDQLQWLKGWPKINLGFPTQEETEPF